MNGELSGVAEFKELELEVWISFRFTHWAFCQYSACDIND